MTDRDIFDASAQDKAFRSFVQETVASGERTADEICKLSELKANGVITEGEFEQQKTTLLA